MATRGSGNFMRLVSDDSNASTLTEDFGNHQEELPSTLPGEQEQLPSTLPGEQEQLPSALPGEQEQLPSTLPGEQEQLPSALSGEQEQLPSTLPGEQEQLPSTLPGEQEQLPSALPGCHRGLEEELYFSRKWDPNLPLKNLPLSMQEKRKTREQRQQSRHIIDCCESWRRSQQHMRKRLREQVARVIWGLQPWSKTMHKIEGKFGVGVKSYFTFLRYLIYLNLLHCLFIGGLALAPALLFRDKNKPSGLTANESRGALDLLLGTGFVEHSPVFYGFYTPVSIPHGGLCLNTPLLFLAGMAAVLMLSAVMELRRTVIGYKHTWLLGNRYNLHMCYKVFCGWDFCIQDPNSARLKHRLIRNDIRLELQEESFHQRVSQRTFRQRLQLYFLRGILNFLVLTLLAGSFSLIYFATHISNKEKEGWILPLLYEYLPSISITVVNVLLPHLFRRIAAFEDYSLTWQVNITLVRSIFLKLATLGMFLLFLHQKDLTFVKTNQPPEPPAKLNSSKNCWENEFGKEMYKLVVFDFLAGGLNAVLLEYPRKLLVEKYPSCSLVKAIGKQSFLIPFHVLDLVYSQTVTWVGLFYSPLLVHISVIKLLLVFYIKKFVLFHCCVPAQRSFRGSQSSVLFHFTLLLGLLIAVVTLSFNVTMRTSSQDCGPFVNYSSIFNMTSSCVGTLPSPVQRTIHYFTSEAFALPLILAEIVVLTSFVSQGRANRKAIERLKEMLIMCSADKRYLVKKHSAWLRTLKSSVSAGTCEDARPTALKDPSGFQPLLLRSVSTP
ncbi:hypothetical protein AGOR_G00196030 [Albula goreensis]|uniref:Transmembrane channel-like protein n=1 Tax=Albula goreensis TaxID=1534307 RepID=A0A8T3CV24_9TELE|nr:hypothetical protein AGOR_G00196030 [Albula goreensis]